MKFGIYAVFWGFQIRCNLRVFSAKSLSQKISRLTKKFFFETLTPDTRHQTPDTHLSSGDLSSCGVYDVSVSVQGDQQDGEGGEEDTGGLGGSHQLAHNLL